MKNVADEIGIKIVAQSVQHWLCSCGTIDGSPDMDHKCAKCGDALHPDQTTPALVGQVVADRYEIIEQIGAGAWGVVYKARQLELDRIVAIKLLRKHLVSDQAKLARFKQEAFAASRLDHSNIVQIFDFGVPDKQQPFFVMEYLDAESLDHFFQKHREDVALSINIFIQTLAALGYAHAQGFVHRDIKPGNILVKTNGDGSFTVKLVDFGVARISENEDERNLTATGELLGTPLYMSPEQCVGDTIDSRSDLYSLGCVMYEQWSGKNPFLASNSFECMMKHISVQPPELVMAGGTIAAAPLQQFLNKALSKDKSTRFQSAQEMSEALANLPAHQPPGQKKQGLGLSRTAVALCCVLLIGAWLALSSLAPQRSSNNPAPSPAVPSGATAPPATVSPQSDSDDTDNDSKDNAPELMREQNGAPETYEETLRRELKQLQEYATELNKQGLTQPAADLTKKLAEINFLLSTSSTGTEQRSREELHVVAVARGEKLEKFNDESEQATVRVSYKGAPMVLLLSGEHVRLWKVTVDPGVKLKKILIHGYLQHNVVGAPGVPVEPIDYDPNTTQDFITTPDQNFPHETFEFIRYIKRKYKCSVDSILYPKAKGAHCIVGPENIEWLSARLLSQVAPLYEKLQLANEERMRKRMKEPRFWARYHIASEGFAPFVADESNSAGHFIGLFDYRGPLKGKYFKPPMKDITAVTGPVPNGPIYAVNGTVTMINPKTRSSKEIGSQPDLPVPGQSSSIGFDNKTGQLYCIGSHVLSWNVATKKWTPISEFRGEPWAVALAPAERCFYGMSVWGQAQTVRHICKVDLQGNVIKKIPLSQPIFLGEDANAPAQFFYVNGFVVVVTSPLRRPSSAIPVQHMIVIEPSTGLVCYYKEAIVH